MATLDTASKAPLHVIDPFGNAVSAQGASLSSETSGIVSWTSLNGTYWLTALAPGSTVVTFSKTGATGSIPVTVTLAPLTLTLGTPEPK